MNELQTFSNTLAATVESLSRSIVRVDARPQHGATGTIYTADGLILTANHVLERDESVGVTLHDGRTLNATLVGRDEGTDLALLKVDATGLAPVTFASTADLRVGHLVLALARPGRSVRASMGIVGTLGESIRTWSGGRLERYIQPDIVRQWGFSGGPLVDASGQVLGLNSAALTRGALVTVPSETIHALLHRVQSGASAQRGFLGVGTYPVRMPKGSTVERALAIVSVVDESPAARAGILVGDILTHVDDTAIEHPQDLLAVLGDKSGREIRIALLRGGQPLALSLTPTARDAVQG